jgi:hypothetical protein
MSCVPFCWTREQGGTPLPYMSTLQTRPWLSAFLLTSGEADTLLGTKRHSPHFLDANY